MVSYPNLLFWIFCITSFISFYVTLVAAGSSGSARKGSKRSFRFCVYIYGFTKVQLTEPIFIIYNFKENRCLWIKDSPHSKTSSVKAAALEKLTTLLDHKTVEHFGLRDVNIIA